MVYHKQSVSVGEALHRQKRPVKIIVDDGRTFRFNEIYSDEGTLYGLIIEKESTLKADTVRVIIPEGRIRDIYLLNEKATKKATLIVKICIIGGVVSLVIYAFATMEMDISGYY